MKRPSRWTLAAIGGAAIALGSASGALIAGPQSAPVEMLVYKSPTCGCCSKWVDHARAAGFKVTTHDQEDLTGIKADAGVPSSLISCHTTIIAGKYVIEGHVPASTIKRLLKEQPKIVGLSAPGMPAGSPGMEGGRTDRYDVIAFDAQGKHTVFERH
jgi:hypothetical protein